ncbi:ABC transporter permease [Piscinibacter koreensis]|uniref:ABC transporter permease n=1 Tax=Piscinibacter koreensis TaxID=2742824 RepID=A0A7Y6NJJ2_9BURK|nr:ABC transporter permease subunit [Schlegelella koreensis]NUZ04351.1 ABC transporter permease [Schlegelella koreensis]
MPAADPASNSIEAVPRVGRWRTAWVVFAKEIVDALRDRRTLLTVLLSTVLMGPLVLLATSALVSSLEGAAERREVFVAGIEHAPTLRNYLERQTYAVKPPPADYERQLRDASFGAPVVVVPEGFEAALARGEAPVVEVVSDSSNRRSSAASGRVEALLAGFARERASIAVALRGVALQLLEPVRVEPHDLASASSRGAQFTMLLPFFVIVAVLYGAMTAAIDTTAGERERGSLEPLLTNPGARGALVVGKWAAVATVSLLIAVLSCLSFVPGQALLRSETLAALFRYDWREALAFVGILLPLIGALSALLMAVAIRCRTVKEAQASATVVLLVVQLLPLVSVFELGADEPWHLAVPALAQSVLMNRVLRGEAIDPMQLALPVGVAVVVGAASIAYVARALRRAALD